MSAADRAKSMLQHTTRQMARVSARDKLLLILEALLCYTLLVLFALAYPDQYRSKLWENGGEMGWNSNPKLRIYFYANHKEPPEIPLIWTQRLTDSNLGIAILSVTVHAARAVLSSLNFLPLWIEMVWGICLVGLWSLSVVGQASGDYSDVDHISDHPWYLTHTCGDSWVSTRGYCQMAQASFVISVMAAIFYICRTILDVWAGMKSRRARDDYREVGGWSDDDFEEKYSDTETLLGSECDLGAAPVKEALSPVLAFFPDDGRTGGWS
ncbi:hypothetical protein LIA77_01429 [Sarocladium implicatum]|nr:hypothetical protein LIA77_01429 [Sarocladium implicatum]